MSGFAPSVEAAKKALGGAAKIETKVHPPGGTGVKFSLDEVAKRVRDGRNDPRLRAWAVRSIHEAGGPQDTVGKARAILAALKKKATYVLDPVGTEFMQQPHQTLCLDELGLCFKGGDCDDLVIAYASATLSAGIPTMVVGQSFDKSGVPSHVIAAILDGDKQWLRVDPSTNKDVGEYVTATKEWWIDPLNPNDKTSTTIAGAGDYVGVGQIPGDRPSPTGLGDAPADPSIAQAAIQQVQAALYSLTTSSNNLQAALAQVAQVSSVVGYDPEPANAINGIADFPTGGVWTQTMSSVCQTLLSQTQFLLGVAQQALDGARDIVADPISNEIGLASLSSDSYVWKTVLTTATDAIIGIYNPAGTLLVGITQALGAVLTPAEVQTQVSTPPTGTIQGVPDEQQGVGNPIVIAGAVAIAGCVAVVAYYYAYAKWCDAATSLANAATSQKIVEFGDLEIKNGVPPAIAKAHVVEMLDKQQTIISTTAKNNADENPFASTLDSLKWVLVAGVAIGGLVAAWPFLKELGESGAAMLHAKRMTAASKREAA